MTADQYCLYAQLVNPSTAQQSAYTAAVYKPGGNGGYGMNYAVCN